MGLNILCRGRRNHEDATCSHIGVPGQENISGFGVLGCVVNCVFMVSLLYIFFLFALICCIVNHDKLNLGLVQVLMIHLAHMNHDMRLMFVSMSIFQQPDLSKAQLLLPLYHCQ